MIKKKENCLYCGEKMESLTAKKSFCSPKCRVYFSREKKTNIIATKEPQISPHLQKSIQIAQKETKAEIKAENEPKEGTLAFFRKYNVLTYAEIDNNS